MSSKLSPKKDDKITASPTKKDDKASLSIMTRHQSAVMNTRQLRNKEVSRRKISAITQLLLSSNKEPKTSHFNKKKSPKDKVKVKKSPKKQVTVTSLVLEAKTETKSVGKKRKIIAIPKGVKPAKAVCKESSTLSVQELIELCEEQSLDDEDFLEILTCESPVWWEQPDSQYYCEDAITPSEETRYFQELFKPQVKTEDTATPSATNIKIPEVKQTDDKFMKKRNKLENLLGNIKNKLTDTADTPKQQKKNTKNVIDNNAHIPKKPQIKKETADKDIAEKSRISEQNKIEDEITYQKTRIVKTPSESTSSSDDMFFGFQNEDILKDLENIDIPIKEDKTCKESSESTEITPEENMEIEDNNSKDNKNINDATSEGKIKTESANPTDKIIEDNNSNSNSFLEINKHVKDVSKEDNSCVDVETKTPKYTESLESITNTSGKDVHADTEISLEKSSSSNSLNPVKIYDIVATTSKNDKMLTTNESNNATLLSNENNNKSTILSEENERSLNSSTIANQKTESDNNIQNVDKDENTKLHNANVKNDNNLENGKKKRKETTNDEKNIKSVNPKHVNKDQLMAVYKKITDKQYSQNCMKTTKTEVESAPTIINNILSSSNGLKTFFNNYTSSSKQQSAKPDIIDDKNHEGKSNRDENNESFTENVKNCNEIVAKEIVPNEVSQNLNNDTATNEKIININKIESEDKLTQINEIKMNEINENKTDDEESANASKTDSKGNINDKFCGDCDGTDTETSFNITSKVKSAKYCLKCSSIFESETCSYCAKISKLNQENHTHQSRKGNT